MMPLKWLWKCIFPLLKWWHRDVVGTNFPFTNDAIAIVVGTSFSYLKWCYYSALWKYVYKLSVFYFFLRVCECVIFVCFISLCTFMMALLVCCVLLLSVFCVMSVPVVGLWWPSFQQQIRAVFFRVRYSRLCVRLVRECIMWVCL